MLALMLSTNSGILQYYLIFWDKINVTTYKWQEREDKKILALNEGDSSGRFNVLSPQKKHCSSSQNIL